MGLPVRCLAAATQGMSASRSAVAAAKQRTGKPIEDLPQEAKVVTAFRADVRKHQLPGQPPFSDAALDAFTQAQIDAAKLIQQRTPPDAGGPDYSLETDLRPAVARISARMAWLVARLPAELDDATVLQQARDWLGASGLQPAEVERLARTLAALRPPQPR